MSAEEDEHLAHLGAGEAELVSAWALELQRAFLLAAACLGSLLLGSTVGPDDFTRAVKRPAGLWLAVFISVLLAPLVAYVVARALGLSSADGIALLAIACCPAGSLAPLFVYYTDSDVPLSLCVVVLTVLMSVGMIPLGVYISSSAYVELDLTEVPNNSVVVCLATIIGAISIGMTFRNFLKKWADRFAKFFNWIPIAITVAMVVVVGITIPHSVHVTAKGVFSVLLYLAVIMAGAYGLGLVCGQTHRACRAIAFSSASKNLILTLTMMHTSFTDEALLEVLPVPTQFLIQYIVIGCLLSVAFRIYRIFVPESELE